MPESLTSTQTSALFESAGLGGFGGGQGLDVSKFDTSKAATPKKASPAETNGASDKVKISKEAQKKQATAAQGTNGQAKTDEPAEKPKDLKSAVANTIAEHIKKGSSRGEISAAIEKEVKRFADDRAEEKQSDEVAESRRGQTRESFARQNNQQLSKDLANFLSGQNDSQQVGNLLDFKA